MLTRTGTYIDLKMNFLFFLFSAKIKSVFDFQLSQVDLARCDVVCHSSRIHRPRRTCFRSLVS